jgi:hypothetical protein
MNLDEPGWRLNKVEGWISAKNESETWLKEAEPEYLHEDWNFKNLITKFQNHTKISEPNYKI